MYEDNELEQVAPFLLIIITLAGAFLRVFLISRTGLWLDEAFSVWMANHPVGEMLQWISNIDQHPPLYYLLLHSWVANFGNTPYYARALSALFGAATIPVIYLTGKRLSGVMVGLAAAVFMALSPFHIYYSQEARMYTLLTFNAAVAIYALVRLLTDPRSVSPIGSHFRAYLHAWRTSEPVEPDTNKEFSYKDQIPDQTGWRGWISRHRWLPIQAVETDLAWVAFIIFTAATLLTHNTAVFYLLAVNIFVLGLILLHRNRKPEHTPALRAPSLGSWIKAHIGILVLWSPWLVVFIRQAARVDQEFWIPKPTWDSVTQTLQSLINASVPGQASQVIVMWILVAVLCLGLVYYRKKLSIFFLLAALFAVPVLGELIVSIRRPIFFDRTLIWITIPLFLLMAAGIAQLKFRFLMIVVLAAIGVNYLFSNGDFYRFVRKEDWSGPAGYVSYYSERGDLILFNSAMVQIPFDYYFKAHESKNFLQVERQGVPDMFNRGIPEPKMTDSDIPDLVSLLDGRNRVWLVYSHNDYTDPLGLIPKTLASKMKLTQQRDFYGSKVQLYEAP